MIDKDNKYTQMQRAFYDMNSQKMVVTNHLEHNDNPDYWNILLGDLKDELLDDKVGLDFGCGCGRNIYNLLTNWKWKRVDGVDIGQHHVRATEEFLKSNGLNNFKVYLNNGIDLKPLLDDEYHFVMSTIVFQHIAVHEIRYNLMSEIYRVLKPNGLFSFQMGFGYNPEFFTVDYYANHYDATGTNSDCDVRVEKALHLVKDLEKIGFNDISYEIKPSWSNQVHKQWIYVKAYK
jgi:SAM-dependent methyltransferase